MLACFDLMPSGYLVVAVRDPALYRDDYVFEDHVTDPVEVVWYDKDWQEEDATVLDFAAEDFPDSFVLAPDEKSLLAVRHPVDADGGLEKAGHTLCRILLLTGEIIDLPVPGTGPDGVVAAAWWPVLMSWSDRGDLLMQAGEEFRRYTVSWEP